jgi:hypothetical protein
MERAQMSVNYDLICLDCKQGVGLSKIITVRYEAGDRETYGFDALGETADGAWEPIASACAEVQHFLMLHRTHELRVLPEHIEKYFDENTEPVRVVTRDTDEYELDDYEYSRSEFFAADPGKLDPGAEADALPPHVIRKLRGEVS